MALQEPFPKSTSILASLMLVFFLLAKLPMSLVSSTFGSFLRRTQMLVTKSPSG